ncbi:pachytene checkpoint protein 2 homolog [Bradysia coprophila]|uniref:pachytene checkpoint protein 2 homolog n=1 Tax=Bradysia coprophila TaxID=38358 RepID=UPI00187DD214|nr:pachytene checkpoint protein 2 homolog [Bradysia coprophila]
MKLNSVEVVCKKTEISPENVQTLVIPFINEHFNVNSLSDYDHKYLKLESAHGAIADHAEALLVSCKVDEFPINTNNTTFFVYKLNRPDPELEMIENGSDEETAAANHWILPSREFHDSWNNLYFEQGLKENLLQFVETSMLFSKSGINPNVISCNRLILLHGPAGTGKTSLCKAIAQKISIRMKSTFKCTHLIEINSHSLFSKWFSESGKLVMKLFEKIRDVVENPTHLVCVLIDEVESIAFARSSSSNEPTDSIRVVNAVLTQLDQIRKHPNVLVLTTSNLTSSIDSAFLDRADIKQYVGFPDVTGLAQIYTLMLRELIDVGLVVDGDNEFLLLKKSVDGELYQQFRVLLEMSKGLSGRTLKKIPFLAYASLVQLVDRPGLRGCLKAMQNAVGKHMSDTKGVNGQCKLNVE